MTAAERRGYESAGLADPAVDGAAGAPGEGAGWDAEAVPAYALRVNGREMEVEDAWLGESLLHVLRERLGLPGSKSACEQGECGSCSVLLDGRLVCACLVLAAAAVGAEVVTAEGLTPERDAGEAGLSVVQRAFVDEGAVQCGFCTPGLVVATSALLEANPSPTDLEVREALSGNLCRCTGYGRIVEAVRAAAERRPLEH